MVIIYIVYRKNFEGMPKVSFQWCSEEYLFWNILKKFQNKKFELENIPFMDNDEK